MFNRKKTPKVAKEGKEPRLKAVRDAYKITKEVKPWIGASLIGIFLAIWAIGIGVGFIWGHPVYTGFISVPLAILGSLFFFTRIAGAAAYQSIEGQSGAGASVLMAIRKGWTTTPAVAVNRSQDMVLTEEKRKTERFAPGVPITEIIVGDMEGQMKLPKLQKHLQKMPKKLSPSQMNEVRARLKAVGGLAMPIPKGPMPKNVKIPKR
jgi:hypothetical protein